MHDPSDPEQVAKTRLKRDCKKTNTCPSADALPAVRPKARSLLQKSHSHWCLDWRSGAHPGTLRCSHQLRLGIEREMIFRNDCTVCTSASRNP